MKGATQFQVKDDPVAQAAVEWLARRDRGLTAPESHELLAWLAADARHREEFDRMAAGFRSMDGMRSVAKLADEADWIFRRAKARQARRRTLLRGAWVAAAAAAVALGAFFFTRAPSTLQPTYEVIASTARTLNLPDGSTVQVNGDSVIEPAFTAGERRVRLVSGEALFTVAHDASRPFYVEAGRVSVRAVGTAFNVRLGEKEVEILVTEGKVRVDDRAAGHSLLSASAPSDEFPLLRQGESVVVDLTAPVSQPAEVRAVVASEIEQKLSWQSTRLVFEETPLAEVVNLFNRYNAQQLALADDVLRARTITGKFNADQLDAFVRLLEGSAIVRAVREDGQPTQLISVPSN